MNSFQGRGQRAKPSAPSPETNPPTPTLAFSSAQSREKGFFPLMKKQEEFFNRPQAVSFWSSRPRMPSVKVQ